MIIIFTEGATILKIAYNDYYPFFLVRGGQPDMNSLESVFIQTFIEKYNLKPEWKNAGGSWGSKDANGTFSGVVGMVSSWLIL